MTAQPVYKGTVYGPPAPGLNSVTGADSLIDKIWNFGQNIFERGVSFYFEKEQTERLTKLREAEAAAELAKKQSYTAAENALTQANITNKAYLVPWLAAAAGGLALYLIARK